MNLNWEIDEILYPIFLESAAAENYIPYSITIGCLEYASLSKETLWASRLYSVLGQQWISCWA